MENRPTISDAALQIELKELFERGVTGPENVYERLRTSFKLGKQRCYQAHYKAHSEWANLANKSTDDTIQANAEIGLNEAYKSKEANAIALHAKIAQLERIKAGEKIRAGKRFVIACHADEIRAVGEIRSIKKQLGDWFGWSTPLKIANTDTEGNSVLPRITLTLPPGLDINLPSNIEGDDEP